MKSICLFTVRNDLEIVLVDLVATRIRVSISWCANSVS
jgi:hypothetical protein